MDYDNDDNTDFGMRLRNPDYKRQELDEKYNYRGIRCDCRTISGSGFPSEFDDPGRR
jgi:hypothetical protein